MAEKQFDTRNTPGYLRYIGGVLGRIGSDEAARDILLSAEYVEGLQRENLGLGGIAMSLQHLGQQLDNVLTRMDEMSRQFNKLVEQHPELQEEDPEDG